MSDFNLCKHGTIHTLDPNNSYAYDWIRENVNDPIYWGSGIVLEQDSYSDILDSLKTSGYTVNEV